MKIKNTNWGLREVLGRNLQAGMVVNTPHPKTGEHMNKVTVTKMPRAELQGDWHDRPLKWQAAGPGTEIQKFPTKREANLYAKIRRKAGSFREASNTYSATI